jgi:hypothetical protein
MQDQPDQTTRSMRNDSDGLISIGNLCQSCYSELEIYVHGEDHGHAYT